MVRDSVQLETAVNTITHEYLLEFTSEYGIAEVLRPELPGPGDRIVDFPEARDGTIQLDRAPNPTKVKTESRLRAPHELPLLTLTASRVIEMDEPATAAPEMPPPEEVPLATVPGADQAVEAVVAKPPTIRGSRKRGPEGVDANAPPKSLRRDHTDRPSGSSRGGKSLAAMQLWLDSNVFMSEGVPADVSDPDPLAFADAPSHPPVDVAHLLDTPEACQDLVDHAAPPGYFTELRHMSNDEFLWQYNVNLARQVAMGSQLRLRFDQEAKLLKKSVAQFSGLKVSNEHLSQRVVALQEQVSREEKLKATFEEFKRYEDDRVEQRWVIGHGLRLAVMKCAESLEMRQAFADVVSAWVAKVGRIERCADGCDHGYFIFGERYWGDAPQYIRDLRPSSSQLTIPVYPEVRDPRNPWACKEEIALADAIAANISRAEKKKKYWIVCRTHGIGSAHHARSDGIPVSVPSVVP
nr:hypothetical protein [Tanacetum cinerariifolium]